LLAFSRVERRPFYQGYDGFFLDVLIPLFPLRLAVRGLSPFTPFPSLVGVAFFFFLLFPCLVSFPGCQDLCFSSFSYLSSVLSLLFLSEVLALPPSAKDNLFPPTVPGRIRRYHGSPKVRFFWSLSPPPPWFWFLLPIKFFEDFCLFPVPQVSSRLIHFLLAQWLLTFHPPERLSSLFEAQLTDSFPLSFYCYPLTFAVDFHPPPSSLFRLT